MTKIMGILCFYLVLGFVTYLHIFHFFRLCWQKWIFCVKLSRLSMTDFHWILNSKSMKERRSVQSPKRNGKKLTSERMLIQMIIQRPIQMQEVMRIQTWTEWLSTNSILLQKSFGSNAINGNFSKFSVNIHFYVNFLGVYFFISLYNSCLSLGTKIWFYWPTLVC